MKPSGHTVSSLAFRVNLYACTMASGAGAVLSGAVLPLLASQQNLNDQQTGLLIGSQFLGNFCGAVTVSKKLHQSLLIGKLTATAGLCLGAVALSQTSPVVVLCVCFFVFGHGFGQMITAANLIVASDTTIKRAARLSFLNMLWGIGATLAPLLIAIAVRRVSVRAIFSAFSLLLLFGTLLPTSQSTSNFLDTSSSSARNRPGWKVFTGFALFFFLYGGTENSLSGWLSTYAQRYTHSSASAAPFMTAAFWAGLNVGRAAGTIVLRHVPERRAVKFAIIGFVVSSMNVTRSHSNVSLTSFAAVCGLCLAPIFPAALSWAVELKVSAKCIRFVLALCGLGASTLPALVGIASYRLTSLQRALWLPAFYGALMLFVLPKQTCAVNPPMPDSDQ